MTAWLTLKQVGGSTNSRGETCRHSSGSQAYLQTASSSSSTWDRTHWKTRNWNSQHSASPDDRWIFLRVRTGFCCLEKNLQPTDGRFDQHSSKTARTELHNMITFHHANTRGSSSKDCTSLSTCSLTHFIHFPYLSDCLTFAHRPFDSRPLFTLRCSTAECRTNTNPISHTNCKSQPRFRSECSQPQFCQFLKPCFFLHRFFLNSVSVHVDRVKETRFRSKFQFFCTGADCFYESNKSSCRHTSSSCLQAEGILLQNSEASWEKSRALGWENRGSAHSRSISHVSRSLPNLIVPPLLEPQICSSFELPTMSPYEISYTKKGRLQFDKFLTSSTFNFGQLQPIRGAISWREIDAAQARTWEHLIRLQGSIRTSRCWTPGSQRLWKTILDEDERLHDLRVF